jgi:ubiquinol-cytochrome c reductase iron-sulfur subunit
VAGAPITADISDLTPGMQMTVQWRGKPVWILRRSDAMLKGLQTVTNVLRDPDSDVTTQQPDYTKNSTRSIKPEFFICVGLCTHLGCVPSFRPEVAPSDLGSEWVGGYFCPCHGSRFDLAGRVYKGVPAPTNLVIPPHSYINETNIIIGQDNFTK